VNVQLVQVWFRIKLRINGEGKEMKLHYIKVEIKPYSHPLGEDEYKLKVRIEADGEHCEADQLLRATDFKSTFQMIWVYLGREVENRFFKLFSKNVEDAVGREIGTKNPGVDKTKE